MRAWQGCAARYINAGGRDDDGIGSGGTEAGEEEEEEDRKPGRYISIYLVLFAPSLTRDILLSILPRLFLSHDSQPTCFSLAEARIKLRSKG